MSARYKGTLFYFNKFKAIKGNIRIMSNYTPNTILSTKQAAACIGWTPRWLRIRAIAGDIDYMRPGARKMFFKAGAIAKFLGVNVEEL